MLSISVLISSISNWNMNKAFHRRIQSSCALTEMPIKFTSFFVLPKFFSFFLLICVLFSDLESEMMFQTSVIYSNAKKHMPFWTSFLLFRITDPLNPIAIWWIRLSCGDWMGMIRRNSFSRARVRIPSPLFLFKFII